MSLAQQEIVHLAGDMNRGVSVTHDLRDTAIGRVTLVYRGRYAAPFAFRTIDCEVYETDGLLSVHTLCPKCGHGLWIDGRNKQISFDTRTGKLDVEKFSCPWEMDESRRQFGFGLCRLELVYDGNVAREA